MTTLVLEFKKIENHGKTKQIIFYLNSKSETIINERDIYDVFESGYSVNMSNIQKSLGFPSYMKFSKELNHRNKGLVNIGNIYDNELNSVQSDT